MKEARGWLLVAGGGLLASAKETWELTEAHEWPAWLSWGLVVMIACAGNAAVQSARDGRARAKVDVRPEAAPRSGPTTAPADLVGDNGATAPVAQLDRAAAF